MLLALLLPVLAAGAGAPFCGVCANGGAPPMANTMLTLSCSLPGALISGIAFASYGTPTGTCPNFAIGSCNANTSKSVVTALCVGQASCTVFPNTTTFLDPCFGTAKELAVVALCSSGAGSGVCGEVPPPAPPPSLANYSATITIDFTRPLGPLRTEPSLQVVSQHLLFRDSPVASTAWEAVRSVGARHVRFVPWIPYPQYGVGELAPPSGAALCGPQAWASGSQTRPVTLSCAPSGGGTIEAIQFASYGRPTGNCGAYSTTGSCHAQGSLAVVQGLCLGRTACSIPMEAFADPCPGSGKWLAVQANCSSGGQHTSWNMSLVDEFMSDFWGAVGGNASEPIPNFSTQPTWMYSASDYNYVEDPAQPWYGYDRGAAPAADLQALGDYYGRMYAYFMLNGFEDEYGNAVRRTSGPPLNISVIEVFNEVDYEHAHTAESYTLEYDAVVRGVRRLADPQHSVRFVGLSLPNIDSGPKVVQWVNYFLNASNHHPEVGLDALNFIGLHAYPTNGPYTPNPDSFALMFDYVDQFFLDKVLPVEAVIAALSPATRTVLDETGTDMDGVLTRGLPPPANNPLYWVASAAYWAYFWGRAARDARTVAVVGASQLMDAPGQEPSVTMLDWSTGRGTARLWVVALLVKEMAQGGGMVATGVQCSSQGGAVFALTVGDRLLAVNMRNAWANASIECSGGGGCVCQSVAVIDEGTGLEPAREEACGEGNTVLLAPYATAVVRFS